MKIIITEEQYKKIFLSGKYDNLITEQLAKLIAATEKLGAKLIGLETTNLTKLKKAFNLADNIPLRTISDLMTALEDTGVSKFKPAQFKTLMNVPTLKVPLLDILSNETQIKEMLKLRATAENLSSVHPKINEIDDFLEKFLPSEEEVTDFVQSYEKTGMDVNQLKRTSGSTVKGKNILGELRTQAEVLEWMKNNGENLDSLTKGFKSVNLLSSEQRTLWEIINKNLDKMLPKINEMDDDLLTLLKTYDINPLKFKKTLLKVLPSKPKQFFLNLFATDFGHTVAGAALIYTLLTFVTVTTGIIGFNIPSLIKAVIPNMSKDPKKENDANIKSKFLTWFEKNSPEGSKKYSKNPEDFTIEIDGNHVSLLDKGGVFGDKTDSKVYDYEYDETNKTFKVIGDDETQSTGTFENSLDGFKLWFTTPKDQGGYGDGFQEGEKPNGIKDTFTVTFNDGEIETYIYNDGKFSEKNG